jgi:hypothetical protein
MGVVLADLPAGIVADEVALLVERASPAFFAGAVITTGVDNWQTGREVIELLAFDAYEVFIHLIKINIKQCDYGKERLISIYLLIT